MVEHILGNYLVDNGKITKEQLKQAIEKQNSVRVKLGLIAVEEGLLTIDEADEINRLQTVMDQRFGDIAVSMGYLSADQVEKLLKKQGNAYLSFVQALVDEELVTMEEIDWLINDFKRNYGYSNSEIEDIKSDDVDRILPLLLPESAKQYQEIIGTAVRILIRMVDRNIYLGDITTVESLPEENMVCQTLVGQGGIIDCFSERDGALLQVCSFFGQEEFERLDMDSLDAAGELLNYINGLYASGMSHRGSFLELMPPVYEKVKDEIKAGTICRVPIFVGDKGLYFTVAEAV